MIDNLSEQVEQLKEQLVDNDELNQIEIKEITESKTEIEKLISSLRSEKSDQKAHYENEIAVLTQKLYLSDTQINELKAQQSENQKSQEALFGILKGFEADKETSSDNVNEILQKQKQDSLIELKKLESEFTATKSRLAGQVETLTSEKSELQLQLKVVENDLRNEIESLSNHNNDLESELSRALEQVKSQEDQRVTLIKSLEANYKSKISSLEHTITNMQDEHKTVIEELQSEKQNDLMFFTNGKINVSNFVSSLNTFPNLVSNYRKRKIGDQT